MRRTRQGFSPLALVQLNKRDHLLRRALTQRVQNGFQVNRNVVSKVSHHVIIQKPRTHFRAFMTVKDLRPMANQSIHLNSLIPRHIPSPP
eukprot:2901103-Amphidinium_carterae.1